MDYEEAQNRDLIRRIEKIEERINSAEREVSTLNAELAALRSELSNRIGELKSDFKQSSAESKDVFKERIDSLKQDLTDDINSVSTTMRLLNDSVSQTTESLQNLHVTQNRNSIKVNTNEKIVWAILGVISTAGLYLLQEFLRSTGGA